MAESVYRVTEVIGVSGESWEAAARNAVETAAKSVRDLRVAEVIREDVTIQNGAVVSYRVRLGISFKFETRRLTALGGADRHRSCRYRAIARAITTRWISLVPS
jgi:dodecin